MASFLVGREGRNYAQSCFGYFSYNFAAVITTWRAFLYRRAVATSGPRVLVKWEGRWVVGRVGAAAGYARAGERDSATRRYSFERIRVQFQSRRCMCVVQFRRIWGKVFGKNVVILMHAFCETWGSTPSNCPYKFDGSSSGMIRNMDTQYNYFWSRRKTARYLNAL